MATIIFRPDLESVKRGYKLLVADGPTKFPGVMLWLKQYYKSEELASLWNNITWCEEKHQQCKTENRVYTSAEYMEFESRNEQTAIELLKLIDKIETL